MLPPFRAHPKLCNSSSLFRFLGPDGRLPSRCLSLTSGSTCNRCPFWRIVFISFLLKAVLVARDWHRSPCSIMQHKLISGTTSGDPEPLREPIFGASSQKLLSPCLTVTRLAGLGSIQIEHRGYIPYTCLALAFNQQCDFEGREFVFWYARNVLLTILIIRSLRICVPALGATPLSSLRSRWRLRL